MRSRYHYEYPLTVKNPLNKEIIVGEVEFYLIEGSSIATGKPAPEAGSGSGMEERLDQDSRSKSEIELTEVKEKRKLILQQDASEFVEKSPESRSNQQGHVAIYMGSDFDFATRPEFQQRFKANSLDQSLVDKVMEIQYEIPVDPSDAQAFTDFTHNI